MKTIYFVRHGSTPGNEGGAYQHTDIPLSAEGLRQAKIVAKRFENIPVDIVVTSDFNRAYMTAKEISTHNSFPIELNPLFREILRPTIVRGRLQEDPEVKLIMDQVKRNWENSDWHHSDEENFHDLKLRGKKALEYLSERKEQRIAVVTHSHFLRMMIALIIMGDNLTPLIYKNILQSFFTANTGITMCKTFEGRLTIHTWNDHEHLGEISK